MLNTFTEYFAGFTTGAIALRLLFAAVLGCIIDWNGQQSIILPECGLLRWSVSGRRPLPS